MKPGVVFILASASSLAHPPSFPARRRRPLPSKPLGASAAPVGDAHPPVLAEWLVSCGVDCGGVEATTFPGGLRGLRATRCAPSGAVLLAVPLALCLTTADVAGAGAAPPWSGGLPRKVQLALQVLLHGRNGAAPSQYGPFLASWPGEAPPLPATVPLLELRREAQCAALVEDSEKHRAWVLDQFEAVKELAPPSDLSPFSFKAFERALYLAGSRSIRLPGGGSALVPLFDMANHSPNPAATYRLSEGDDAGGCSVELVARTDIAAGEEVSISYGAYPNRIVGECYGFVPRRNPHDYEAVTLLEVLCAAKETGTLDKDPAALEGAVAALGLDTTQHRILATGPKEGLWLALRAALATDDEYEELREILEAIDMDEADEEDLWEFESEKTVIRRAQIMQAACTVLEQRMSTESTLEEDNAMLRNRNLSAGIRLLVELRKERKHLLCSASQRMAAVLKRPQNAGDILSLC